MGGLGVLVSKCYQHSDLFLCSLFFIFLLLAILQPLCKLTRGVFSLRVVIITLSVSQKKKKQNKIGNKKLGYRKKKKKKKKKSGKKTPRPQKKKKKKKKKKK